MAIDFKVIFTRTLFYITAVAVSANTAETSEAEWPRFIIAVAHKTQEKCTLFKFNPITNSTEAVGSVGLLYRSLESNAFSDTICHFHHLNDGIVCHQNGTDFIPDIPRSNAINSLEFGDSLESTPAPRISLSPFGDHLIFQEAHGGGVWIFSLRTQRGRLLISERRSRFEYIEVDWDNGYIVGLRNDFRRFNVIRIEVWHLRGDSGVSFRGRISFSESPQPTTFQGLALDTSTSTAYFGTHSSGEYSVSKASYSFGVGQSSIPAQLYLRSNVKDFGGTIMSKFGYFKNGLFWTDLQARGPNPKIYRLDLSTFEVEVENVPFFKDHDYVYSTAIFENTAEVENIPNPCSKCSHICIPRRGSGYECTCPFGQPLQDYTVEDGIQTTCSRPWTVVALAIAEVSAAGTSAPNWHLQTYDVMSKLGSSKAYSSVFRTSAVIPNPDGYCVSTSESDKFDCYSFADTSNFFGTWSLGPSALRVLDVTRDDAIVWFDGSCIKYMASSKETWVLRCDPGIDPDNVVLDHLNWHLFYRNKITSDLVHLDLMFNKSTSFATLNETQSQPIRFATDMSNGILYYMSETSLYRLYYSADTLVNGSSAKIILKLDERGFKDQHLKLIDRFLYWIEVRDQPFIVRFNPQTETRETFVKMSSGYNILVFGVSKPGFTGTPCFTVRRKISRFCRRNRKYHLQCWEPVQIQTVQDHDDNQVNLTSVILRLLPDNHEASTLKMTMFFVGLGAGVLVTSLVTACFLCFRCSSDLIISGTLSSLLTKTNA